MRVIKLKEYKKTEIKVKDYPTGIVGELISEPCEIYCPKGELLALYIKAPKGIYNIAKYISENTKPAKSARTSGIPQQSTVYGVLPRFAIREDYCRFSRHSKVEKQLFAHALELNEKISALYKRLLPQQFNHAIEKVRTLVSEDYRIVDTPWTTVNYNVNQVIKYHKDAGNFKTDLSNVLIVKRGVIGGYLPCPELGATLAQDNGYMVFFKGQEILHGVTPCTFTGPNSYRSSIVHYTMEGLKNCYPYEEEMQRLKEVKTAQAKNRKQKMKELSGQLAKKKVNK